MSTPPHFLIQMSGAPGSGKSTTARLLGQSMGAVVVDHDILRSSFLEAEVPFDKAAKHAYQLQWTLAEDMMKQGLGVIVDSVCNYEQVLNQGSALAKKYGYTYWYVECQVRDIDLLDKRLRARDPLPSQRTGVERPPAAASDARPKQDPHELFQAWIEKPWRPNNNAIVVDSTDNPEVLRDYILKQILG